jgi:Restriction endonuclease BglII
MTIDLLPAFLREHYEIHETKHACAVLHSDFPSEWRDVVEVLTEFRFRRSWIVEGGGSKSKVAAAIDSTLTGRGWEEKSFNTKVVVDETVMDSPTHSIDCFKNRVALEIEWNNKDPFFDRDLNNFRLLFDLRAISVGIIVTRCDELQELFKELGKNVADKYGAATTHMGKLIPRIEGGGGGGCPLLVFGITPKLYVEDV